MFQTKIFQKIKTNFMFKIFFLGGGGSKIVPFMRQDEKNVVKPDRSQMTIWRTRIASWITKITNTNSEYVILHFHSNNGYSNALQCYIVLSY